MSQRPLRTLAALALFFVAAILSLAGGLCLLAGFVWMAGAFVGRWQPDFD